MRFDINACFGHWPYWNVGHNTPEDLIELMDKSGIEQAAVLSLRAVFHDWRAGNDETLAAAQEYDRFVPMATVSPFLWRGPAELAALVADGFRGIRLYPVFHGYALEDDFTEEICRGAEECGVPVMIPTRLTMNWRFKPIPTASVGTLAKRHPETQFILSGPNWGEFQELGPLMQKCANIAFEISCLQAFEGVKKLVSQVGCERILLGTGAVLQYPACNVEKLNNAEIERQERRAIESGNALRLLRSPARERVVRDDVA